MNTRDMILDVMSDIDPEFIKEHLDRANITGFRKFIRFAAPVTAYAAACIVILMILPHIIGKAPKTPPTNSAVIPGITETYSTTEPDITSVSKTTEDEFVPTVTKESDVNSEESRPEDILTSESYDAYETEPAETTSPVTDTVTSTSPPDTAPAPITTPEPESEPIPEPDGMVHVTDGSIPYSYVKYDNSYNSSDYIYDLMSADPVFTDADSFRDFISKIYVKLPADFYNPLKELYEESGYFNKEFFKTHNLYFNHIIEGSGSIGVHINDVKVSNGGLHISLDRYEPAMQTCDVNYIYFLVAVEKSHVKNNNVTYSYTTYFGYHDSDYGVHYDKYVGIDGVTTYILKEIPDDKNGILKEAVIMRNTDDMSKFLEKISAVCNGDTDKYFREMPQNSRTTFEIYDLVYLGIFNTSTIYHNGGIKTNLTDDGILEIIVPAPHMEQGDTNLANMSIARLPKNVLDDVSGIKVITQ